MKRILLALFLSLHFSASLASGPETGLSKKEQVSHYIKEHMKNGDAWYPLGHALHLGVQFPSFPPLHIAGLDIDLSPSLHLLMLFIAGGLMILLFVFLYKKNSREAPTGLTNALETLVIFVRDQLVYPFLGEKDGRRLAPFFLTLFFFLLFLNYLSLVPGMATATANINVTAAFSLLIIGAMLIGGVVVNGPIKFFSAFIPPGIPVYFLPVTLLIFLLELVGYLAIKPFALTMRLFANMLAGHLVIFNILGLLILNEWGGIPYIVIAIFIYTLEILVAFLQAFIFTLLSSLFVGSIMHPSH